MRKLWLAISLFCGVTMLAAAAERPLAIIGAMPEEILKLTMPHIENHERILKAALNPDLSLVADAFMEDPNVKGKKVSRKDVEALIKDMLKGTEKYLPDGWKKLI